MKNRILISLLLFISINTSLLGFRESTELAVLAASLTGTAHMVYSMITSPDSYEMYLQTGVWPSALSQTSAIVISSLKTAFAIGLIVKMGLDVYGIYIDWVRLQAEELDRLKKEQEAKEAFAVELKYTDRAVVEGDLIDRIKKTLRKVIDLKIVESGVFPTTKSKVFVLQNIQDFFTFEHRPELNPFVYQAAMQIINDLQRDAARNKPNDQEILIDMYRDYFINKQPKPLSKMSIEELTAVKKDFETILKSERAVASTAIKNDQYEEVANRLIESNETLPGEQQLFVALEATALVSLITHIEFMLNMRPKEATLQQEELLQAQALLARKNEEKPLSQEAQYATVVAALKTKGLIFPEENKQKLMPTWQQEEIEREQEQKRVAFAAAQQAKKQAQSPAVGQSLWSRITSWWYSK